MEVLNEDGTIFAEKSLTTDLNADIGTNNNERSLAVDTLPHLLERPFVVCYSVYHELLVPILFQNLLFGEFAFSI